jgi:hypothetical protein
MLTRNSHLWLLFAFDNFTRHLRSWVFGSYELKVLVFRFEICFLELRLSYHAD